jgi:hypothetical protein
MGRSIPERRDTARPARIREEIRGGPVREESRGGHAKDANCRRGEHSVTSIAWTGSAQLGDSLAHTQRNGLSAAVSVGRDRPNRRTLVSPVFGITAVRGFDDPFGTIVRSCRVRSVARCPCRPTEIVASAARRTTLIRLSTARPRLGVAHPQPAPVYPLSPPQSQDVAVRCLDQPQHLVQKGLTTPAVEPKVH